MSEVSVRSSPTYITWKAPGSPVVRFRRRVMEAIMNEVTTVFSAVPHRGAETGGILLGAKSGDDILIDDFEPAPCEHRFGPSYRLSDADGLALEETLAWFRSGAHPVLSVLGYFRGHTRPDFALDRDDEQLIQTHFPGPETIVLLIQPTRTHGCTAGFFFLRDGRFEEASQPAPFPFVDAAENAAPGEPAPAIIAPVSPAIEPTNGQTGAPAPPEKPSIPALPLAAEPLRRLVTRPSVPSIMPHAYVPRESWADEDEDKPRRENFWIAFAVVLAVMGVAVGYLSLRSDDGPEKPAAVAAREQRPANEAPADQPKPSPTVPAAPAAARAPGGSADRVTPLPSAETDGGAAGVRDLINRWSDALKRGDLEEAAGYYAPRVSPYFSRRGVSRDAIRQGLRKALGTSGKFDIHRISGLKIAKLSGDRAVVTFRKRWQTSGGRKSAGEEQDRLTLVRSNGAWQIASEQDQKVYWMVRR
jgi:hypothetical protein